VNMEKIDHVEESTKKKLMSVLKKLLISTVFSLKGIYDQWFKKSLIVIILYLSNILNFSTKYMINS
jgi:hypothetical protein